MRNETKIVVSGRSPELYGGAVNTPVVRTSTVIARNMAEWDRLAEPGYKGLIYGRLGTQTVQSLEAAIADLEGAEAAFCFPSGLNANIAGIMSFVSAGDHVLVTDTVYGPVRRYLDNELKRFGIEVTYYDPRLGAGIAALIRDTTRVVYTEAPGSLSMEMQDIPAIAAAAHARGAIVAMDNTWATPLYFSAIAHGVDVSIQSATKYIVGHSDVGMGIVSASGEAAAQVKKFRNNYGLMSSPDDAYLAARGLRTLHVRLRQHQQTATGLATWLGRQPEVEKILYPALPEDEGHAIWKRDFTGASGLFTVLLRPMPAAVYAALIDGMELFSIGASWGGFESLIMPVHPEKVRSATPWTHEGPVLRFHAGLEDPADLLAGVEAGFRAMRAAAAAAG